MDAQEAARERTIDLTCRIALGLSGAVGAAAFAAVLHARGAFDGDMAGLHFGVFVLVLIVPFAIGPERGTLLPFPAIEPAVAPLTWPFQAAPLLVLPGGPATVLLGLGVLVQGNLLARSKQDAAAGWALPFGPALVLAGMASVDTPLWGWLLPASLFAAAMALLALQERRARRRRLERAVRSDYGAVDGNGEPHGSLRPAGLPLRAAVMAATTLAVLAAVFAFVSGVPQPWRVAWDLEAEEAAPENARTARGSNGSRAQKAFGGIFPDDVRYSGGVTRLVDEKVMQVVPHAVGRLGALQPRTLAPLYMRGLALEVFDDEGASYGSTKTLRTITDADDGTRNGWIEFAREGPAEDVFELLILQQPIRTERDDCILFCPEPALAVDRERVRSDGEGLLLAAGATEEWLTYRAICADRRSAQTSEELQRAAARHSDARFTALPPASQELEALTVRARAMVVGARTDLERVRAVLEHFQNYDYSIQPPGFPGLGAVTRFMSRRKGHCTHFASAAALLLRTLEMPTRVAAGFAASEWSNEDGCFVVTTRDAHAWLEVYFEGFGWTTFDPTPPDRRREALQRAAGGGALGTWMGDVLEDFAGWAGSGGERMYLESLFAALMEAPRAIAAAWGRAPFLLGVLFAALVIGIAWRIARAMRKRPGAPARDGVLDDSHYATLLRALARHGFHKRPAQTPREFAALVALSGGEAFAAVRPITERLYRSRFGGIGLAEKEERAIGSFVASLRALKRP